MSGGISARSEPMEDSHCPVNKKRRLIPRPCLQVDNTESTRSQWPTFLSLPEDIVSRIISELTLKEAVRMSAICSKLRTAWIYHPNLDLGMSTVGGSDISTVRGSNTKKRNRKTDPQKGKLNVEKFIDTVNTILRGHSGIAVNKLAINFELRKEHASDIDGWVSFAIASKAKMVTLNFYPYPGSDNNYAFPCHLFSSQNASYLRVLRLGCVTFGPSPDFCGFPNLTTLALERVLVPQDLQYLLLKCPALERLSIQRSLLHDLHASEPLVRLKYLCVQGCTIKKIDVLAPNLSTFEYRGGSQVLIMIHGCKLKTASIVFHVERNLEYVFTRLPKVLRHVETLHVEVFVETQMPGFTHAPLTFLHLRHLTMKIIFSSAKRGNMQFFNWVIYWKQLPIWWTFI